MTKGDIVELFITDLAFGGAGVGRLVIPEGILRPTESRLQDDIGDFVVFVEGVAPGDRVSARLTKIKRNFAEARLERVLIPSPTRIASRCKHFNECGGCTFQFLSYENQLKWKEKIVKDAIERIGGFENAPIAEIQGSPSPWFYRNKMEFTFVWGGPTVPLLGLHKHGKFDEVFDLQECYLQSKFSVEVIQWMEIWAARHRLTPCDLHTNAGLLKTLVIREARGTGEWLVNIITTAEPFPQREKLAKEIMQAFPQITSLFHTIVKIQKGRRTEITEKLLAGKPFLTEIVRVAGAFRDSAETLSLIFDIAPAAFFQTNSQAAEHLLALLLAFGSPLPDDIVLDLYCGTGIMGMFFAKLVRKVIGVELNASSIESARRNAEKNGLENIEFFCGDTGDFLEKKYADAIKEKPSIIIVDPPRSGLTAKTIDHIKRLSPAKILYVSCNPTTLARDLKMLCGEGGQTGARGPKTHYIIKKIQPLDMFPQTYHVECVCRLDKI